MNRRSFFLDTSPRWVPLVDDGSWWQLFSSKGKKLGSLLELNGSYYAFKTCCRTERRFSTMLEAATYVNTVTHCTECKLSCIPAGVEV